MSRAVWKGAVNFGLVHVPVELHSAESRDELKFTMLDRRDLAAVGYKRFNKRSGKEVPWEEIVKGYEYEDDRFVVLTDEDFRLANVEATQTVEVFGFVQASAIPDYYFQTPFVLVPMKRGEKGYALLRYALRRTDRVGLATIVLRHRQHLCTVQPEGMHLLVLTLRYQSELKALEDFPVGAAAESPEFKPRELEMAQRLVKEMEESFDPATYTDRYRDDLMQRIEAKIAAGETEVITEPSRKEPEQHAASNVVDLMTALKRSLEERGGANKGSRGGAASVTHIRRHAQAAKKGRAAKTRRKNPKANPGRRASR